jgi:putative ABC transport system permease protein
MSWWRSAVDSFLRDARYALRTLRRTPGFTAAAIVTLALGIGANSAIFSVVHAVLLRPLPYPEADRIVQLVRRHPAGEGERQTGRRYLFFRDHLGSVDAMAAWRNPTGINLVMGDTAEFIRAMPVSSSFFELFGFQPLFGQTFRAEHDHQAGPDEAVLNDTLWRRQFGGDPRIVGMSILLGQRSFRVIGIMPPAFSSIPPADLYVPLRPSTSGPGGGFNYYVAARLRDGVSREQADADSAGVWEAMRREFPREIIVNELPSGFAPLQATLSKYVRPALMMMLGAVGLLLLIACANTANLLLARASGRGREIAVRAALGAARGRIIRQLLTESVLLALVGAAVGLVLAYASLPALLALTPVGFTVYQDARIDGTVLGVTLAVAVMTGVFFGLAPAIGLSRHDLIEVFKDGARSTGSVRSAWLRRALVGGEVALCMLLLVGASLLIQTFVKLSAIDPGFDGKGVLTARMALQGERYASTQDINRFFDQGLERLRRIPGVRSAAVVNGVPIERGLNLNVDILDGDGPEKIENALTDWRYASADYFATMGIPIVAGRAFEERDRAGSPPVAVVSERFAKQFFKNSRVLGRHIRIFDSDRPIEIVGIAKDVREQGLRSPALAVMYVPISQANPAGVRTSHQYFQMSWVIRARETGPELVREVREAIRSLDPQQPFSTFRTMAEVKDAAVADEKLQMTLAGVLAGIGLLLAAAGIYGLVAYTVAERTRELGIRIAVGATRSSIVRSVIRSAATTAAAGVVVGGAASIASARVLREFVWGIDPLDPTTYIAVAVTLMAVAVLASLVPALRVVRLNPIAALRE